MPSIATTAEPRPDGTVQTIPGMPLGLKVVPADAATRLSDYRVRWDFNGDGMWDTGTSVVTSTWLTRTFSALPVGLSSVTYTTVAEVQPAVAGPVGEFASQQIEVLNQPNRAPVPQMRPLSYQIGAPAAVLDWRSSYDPDQPFGDEAYAYSVDVGNNGSWEFSNVRWGTQLQGQSMPAQTYLLSASSLAAGGVNTSLPGTYQVALRVTDSYDPGRIFGGPATKTTVFDVIVESAPAEGIDTLLPAWSYANDNHAGHDHDSAQIWYSVFSASDLGGISLRGAEATSTLFLNCNLTGADLRDAMLNAARFDGSDLRGADFSGADLTGVTTLPLATCDSTTLYDANTVFTGTDFDPAAAGWTMVPEPAALLAPAIAASLLLLRRKAKAAR